MKFQSFVIFSLQIKNNKHNIPELLVAFIFHSLYSYSICISTKLRLNYDQISIISTAFWGAALNRGRCLLESGAYSDLVSLVRRLLEGGACLRPPSLLDEIRYWRSLKVNLTEVCSYKFMNSAWKLATWHFLKFLLTTMWLYRGSETKKACLDAGWK